RAALAATRRARPTGLLALAEIATHHAAAVRELEQLLHLVDRELLLALQEAAEVGLVARIRLHVGVDRRGAHEDALDRVAAGAVRPGTRRRGLGARRGRPRRARRRRAGRRARGLGELELLIGVEAGGQHQDQREQTSGAAQVEHAAKV